MELVSNSLRHVAICSAYSYDRDTARRTHERYASVFSCVRSCTMFCCVHVTAMFQKTSTCPQAALGVFAWFTSHVSRSKDLVSSRAWRKVREQSSSTLSRGHRAQPNRITSSNKNAQITRWAVDRSRGWYARLRHKPIFFRQ